jgi:indolepyruvate ferredoxin oxidoreductase
VTKTVVALEDKYVQESGQVFLSSLQGLVRLLLEQARRDKAAGLTTGGYVSGYRGSPITTLDAQLWAARDLLEAHAIRFEPGLNEELAATSLRGTQQLQWFGKSRYDGVFSLWYGKGLGVDRACEALKLGNLEGTAPNGGVLVVAGDDHAAKSSASAHQSEHTLIAGFIPVLYPATTDEILEFGLYGWALSRFSGLYVGLKTITDTLDLTATVTLPSELAMVRPNLPQGPSLNLRLGMPAPQQEALVVNHRLPAAQAFVRANCLDRLVLDSPRRAITIVTAGKAYLDVCQALQDLGLDEASCRELGIRLVKIGMVWPLEPSFVTEACAGSREVLVVEEKRPLLQEQLAGAFYRLDGDQRPVITGKTDDQARELFSSSGVLDPAKVRRALVARLQAHGLLDEATRKRSDELARLEEASAARELIAIRPAYFCSGCPHNTSTVVPDGSMAMGATGCHGLAVFMPERNTMPTMGMGSEGMPWVAAQSFVDTPHMFQNMGDGTFTHSGLLSIRAAIAAKTNVTFKVLFNDAVAMTGGQPPEGSVTAERIVKELVVEGAKPVVLLSDDPDRFERSDIPAEVRILHRDQLDVVQRELRELKGTSAIVYDQTCANEKRRRRKRGAYPDPDMRLFINAAVCEGCGDCSRQSNCLSVQPLETEFGRKRAIDQSTCNKDYSCIKGFCPSFVTVRGGRIAKKSVDTSALAERVAQLPKPAVVDVLREGYALLVTGIGGTGVLTVGAVLGMAAHLEGKAAKVLDMTGMAQKGGAVTSHIRVAANVEQIPSARLGTGQTDLLIACDLIVASGHEVLASVRPATKVIANSDVVPTGEFQTNQNLDLSANRFLDALRAATDEQQIASLHAGSLATKLVGDSIFTNLMMVGFAAQKGKLPVGLESIEQAIRLNGVAVENNLKALMLGRFAAAFPEEAKALAGMDSAEAAFPQTLGVLLDSRRQHLTAYQNARYAADYVEFIEQVAEAVERRGISNPEPFLMEVANQLARLMAYKDEYEVARLYSDPRFSASLRDQFEGDFRIGINLAPPLIAFRKDAKTGRPRKIEFGQWILPVFGLLTRLKFLRGTPFDAFGYTAERRMERRLIGEYKDLICSLLDDISDVNMPAALEVAAAASSIAGFGAVKDAGVADYRSRVEQGLEEFRQPSSAPVQPKPQPAFT